MTSADVERLYQDVLNRKADPDGLEFYTGMSYEQAKKELEGSPEYLTNEYYKEKFGTPLTYDQRELFPADMSLADRYAKIDSFTTPLTDTTTPDTTTPDTTTPDTTTPDTTTPDITTEPPADIMTSADVERLYQDVLNRRADPDGLEFYTGMSYGEAERLLRDSPEYFTNEYYKEKFGTPLTYDQRELFPADMSLADRYAKIDSFTTPLTDTTTDTGTDTGTDTTTTTPDTTTLGSPEARAGLQKLYQNILFREADQPGLEYYVNRMQAETDPLSLEDIRQAFMVSDEAIGPARIRRMYQGILGRDATPDELAYYSTIGGYTKMY